MFCVYIGDICSPVYIRVTCVLLYLLLYLAMAQGGLYSAPTVDRTSKPLYLKNNDLRGTSRKQFTDFDLIDPIKRVIGDDLLCVQLDRNLWRIYLTRNTVSNAHKMIPPAPPCFVWQSPCFALGHPKIIRIKT